MSSSRQSRARGVEPEPAKAAVWDPRLTPEERKGVVYVGRREEADIAVVYVYDKGRCLGNLSMTDIGRRKSPTGFEWGYGGSGPAALAHSILEHAMMLPGVAMMFEDDDAELAYQDFKAQFVMEFDRAGFKITAEQVILWAVERLGRVR